MSVDEVRPIRDEAERQACYDIRHTVFVGEQGVPVELERDEYDATDAVHFIALAGGVPLGTGRVRVLGDSAKVQRVAVLARGRGTGVGVALMRAMIDRARLDPAVMAVSLGSQISAVGFYERLGFTPIGQPFLDAGIVHRTMRLPLSVDG